MILLPVFLGASDAGVGACYVHSFWHWSLSGAVHLHEELDISRQDKKSKKQQDSTYPIKNEVRSNTQNRLGELRVLCARVRACACRGAGICGDFFE